MSTVVDAVARMGLESCSNLLNIRRIKGNSVEEPLALLVLASDSVALRIHLFRVSVTLTCQEGKAPGLCQTRTRRGVQR